jgi:hypothetical protein
MRRARWLGFGGALALAAGPAGAQDARLARLDPATGQVVARLVDSALAAGLPAEPLVDKALEGASKHAPGPRIADAVRTLLADLERTRDGLGGGSEAELVAGAAALRAGLPDDALGELRRARSGGSLTVPLATLADLVARGVPVETAEAVILSLAARGETDAGYVELRRVVEADIGAGVPPAAAASVRAQGGRPPDKVVPPGQTRGKKQGQVRGVPGT